MHIKSKKALERNQSETRKRLAIERTCVYEGDFSKRPMLGTRANVVRSSLDRPLSRGDIRDHVRILDDTGHCVRVVSKTVARDLKKTGTNRAIVDCSPRWKIRHHG